MVKCSFCGEELKKGGGKLYAKKDGTVFYFCSNKCEKSMLNKKKKPSETKWTEAYHKLKKTLIDAKKKET